ncbi:Ras family protein [Trichomonas vaginalis G3]|uniref:Ras family protein n=1 Tax=Trichomonas vaginalis (strain ATCC PRA-98 / G3) TaxID=412133 RepID=A2EXV3_TRIV3|nr:GTPase protein [Trichomonas vaginalis G3]EAY02486.1 Ras family protein [Trichomonas vaginalis G3]KAI5529062.1 GTPase protein [Trichomonas vaginalis G3]|eukprot:XP_001314725.1 Ras family protein [Trichomonas vaginalis G3]
MRGDTSETKVLFSIENLPQIGEFYNVKSKLSEDDLSSFSEQNLSSKFIIVGDSGVGKSCLLNRIAHDEFSAEYKSTIGASFTSAECLINGNRVKMALWDMAGQEQFTSVNRLYFRGANVVFLCFDLTSQKSFDNASRWLSVVHENTSNVHAIFLVGCKSDLTKVVDDKDISRFCTDNRCEYFETSSKESKMTTELAKRSIFVAAISIQQLRQQAPKQKVVTEQPKPVNLAPPPEEKPKKKCC